MISEVYNMDCMEYMSTLEDNAFDLAISDPPFGIGEDWKKRRSGRKFIETSYKNDIIPDLSYFRELRRISKNQIIWGYNYYVKYLGATNNLIIWDKLSSDKTSFYSMGEIAWTSFKIPLRIVHIPWDGARKGLETGICKIHPHQKPLELYSYLINHYAKKGDKILDTHLGSGSSRIVAYKLGFDFVGCEIDKYYFDSAQKRFENECLGIYHMPNCNIKQLDLF